MSDLSAPNTAVKSALNSISRATWLLDADEAQVQVALRLADELDRATDPAEIIQLSKALTDVYGALGLNPRGRTGKAETPKEVNPLEAIIKKEAARERKATPSKQTPTASKSRTIRK